MQVHQRVMLLGVVLLQISSSTNLLQILYNWSCLYYLSLVCILHIQCFPKGLQLCKTRLWFGSISEICSFPYWAKIVIAIQNMSTCPIAIFIFDVTFAYRLNSNDYKHQASNIDKITKFMTEGSRQTWLNRSQVRAKKDTMKTPVILPQGKADLGLLHLHVLQEKQEIQEVVFFFF